MASNQHFCLRWNNHQSTLISVFDHLLESGTLVDCTLAAEGQFLKAHKVVLSACSPYLEALLSQHYEKHPILILKDVTFHELKSMLDYMYRGEVNISQEQLGTFLKAAESLQIKGLTDSSAISESRDFERSRELERARDINRVDRPIGVPKRMDIRKHISRSHSPLIGLPPNLMMNVDQRGSKHSLLQEIISASPTVTRNREGSTSPSNKRKRQFPPYLPSNDDPSSLSNALENNHHEENHKTESKNKDPSSVFQNVNSVSSDSPAVPPLHNSKRVKKKNDNDNLVESVTVKQEVKTEHVDFSDEVNNDDSVEDLTVDEEEEEMDEGDISKPGPSSASNSHVAGVPWHIAGEGNGEEMLLAGQQESQDLAVRSALECTKCHKTYSSPHTLRRHVRLECGKEPRFLCPYCPHRTKQRYNLMLHIGRTHRDVLSKAAVSVYK